jgi:hypothetical protein
MERVLKRTVKAYFEELCLWLLGGAEKNHHWGK